MIVSSPLFLIVRRIRFEDGLAGLMGPMGFMDPTRSSSVLIPRTIRNESSVYCKIGGFIGCEGFRLRLIGVLIKKWACLRTAAG